MGFSEYDVNVKALVLIDFLLCPWWVRTLLYLGLSPSVKQPVYPTWTRSYNTRGHGTWPGHVSNSLLYQQSNKLSVV